MPPLSALPLLLLLLLAGAALVASVVGQPRPMAAVWARSAVRLGLLLALADAVSLLYQLQAGGTVTTTLWELAPNLPVTLAVDRSGAALAIMVLVAALVVSWAAHDEEPLASAALGLAALGAVGAAFAGDLLSLYIGLQLSSAGGIGLSYARRRRAASLRMLWALGADQAIGLVWLAALVELWHRTSTLGLQQIPTGYVTPALAGVLLLPVVVRLLGCALAGAAGAGSRGADVGDWLAVVAIPTSLVLFLRVLGLGGGSWPTPWFGTCLDLLALALGAAALWQSLVRSTRTGGLRALLLAQAALVVVGFGQNSADGTLLALAAGLFVDMAAAFLPRALLPRSGAGGGAASVAESVHRRRLGGAAGILPCFATLALALLGLDLALRAGLVLGVTPALAYLGALVALVFAGFRLRVLVGSSGSWPWPLWVPALGLAAAAALPGWAVTVAAAALVPPGQLGPTVLIAPDPLSLLAPGFLWPGGYLLVLGAVGLLAAGALRLAAGPMSAGPAPPPAKAPPALVLPLAPAWLRLQLVLLGLGPRLLGGCATMLELADREVTERPVWIWLAGAVAAAWLLAEYVRP
ncbi:MAG: hypothetical protein ACREN7_06640 [Candidatus Dormibacteria bacterium]